MQIPKMLFAFLVILLFTTDISRANTQLRYYLTVSNFEEEIRCDLFSISGEKGMCRDGTGMITYKYSDISKIEVFSGKKSFVFTKELQTEKEELAAAFETINNKKLNELKVIYREKQAYLAEKQKRKLEELRLRAKEREDNPGLHTYPDGTKDGISGGPGYASGRKEPKLSKNAQEFKDFAEWASREKQKRKLEEQNKKRPQVIHGSGGVVLNRAAGGYTDQYGTFYSDAAGGIINTKTGKFIPVH